MRKPCLDTNGAPYVYDPVTQQSVSSEWDKGWDEVERLLFNTTVAATSGGMKPMHYSNDVKVTNDILKVIAATLERMETLMQTTGTFKELHDNTSRKPPKAKGGKKR